jgi:hypothetical protein
MGRGARLTFVIVGAKKLFDISHDARPRAIGQWAVGQLSHRPPPPAKPQQTRGQELRVVGRQRVAAAYGWRVRHRTNVRKRPGRPPAPRPVRHGLPPGSRCLRGALADLAYGETP